MIRVNVYLWRKQGTTLQEFSDYWTQKDWPLIAAQPGSGDHSVAYTQLHRQDLDLPGVPLADHDGVAQITFDRVEGALAFFTSDSYTNVIAKDEENFLDRSRTRILFASEIAV